MRMEITKELLQGYRSKKDEILELDYILKNRWRDEGLIGNDVIFDYSKGYPMPQGVVGFDKESGSATEGAAGAGMCGDRGMGGSDN